MNEIEKLLNELKSIQAGSAFNPKNSKDFWSKIGAEYENFAALGFGTKDEMKLWMEMNPYNAIA